MPAAFVRRLGLGRVLSEEKIVFQIIQEIYFAAVSDRNPRFFYCAFKITTYLL